MLAQFIFFLTYLFQFFLFLKYFFNLVSDRVHLKKISKDVMKSVTRRRELTGTTGNGNSLRRRMKKGRVVPFFSGEAHRCHSELSLS